MKTLNAYQVQHVSGGDDWYNDKTLNPSSGASNTACASLGSFAGNSAGLITAGLCTLAKGGNTCGVLSTTVGALVGAAATDLCKDAYGSGGGGPSKLVIQMADEYPGGDPNSPTDGHPKLRHLS